MTLTESRARQLAIQHGVPEDAAIALLRGAGVTVVPDFAGRPVKPGASIPTDLLRTRDLVGELQADGLVWVEKSPVGYRRKSISHEMWVRLAEQVAQTGGSTYLHQ